MSETIESTTSFRFIELSKVMSKVAIYRITGKIASLAQGHNKYAAYMQESNAQQR